MLRAAGRSRDRGRMVERGGRSVGEGMVTPHHQDIALIEQIPLNEPSSLPCSGGGALSTKSSSRCMTASNSGADKPILTVMTPPASACETGCSPWAGAFEQGSDSHQSAIVRRVRCSTPAAARVPAHPRPESSGYGRPAASLPGRLRLTPAAREQPGAERAFEARDALANCGLGQPDLGRRARNGAGRIPPENDATYPGSSDAFDNLELSKSNRIMYGRFQSPDYGSAGANATSSSWSSTEKSGPRWPIARWPW